LPNPFQESDGGNFHPNRVDSGKKKPVKWLDMVAKSIGYNMPPLNVAQAIR
jgi:hypothetical protein